MYLATFSFKEEGFLATHPPSCHPWMVFGCLENERKWVKMIDTGKEREELKASCPKRNLINEEDPLVTVFSWAYILPQNNTNYQNEQKQLTITRIKWEEIKKGTKVKRRRKGEQWQGQGNFADCEFLQPAKFRSVANFRNLNFPTLLLFFCFLLLFSSGF